MSVALVPVESDSKAVERKVSVPAVTTAIAGVLTLVAGWLGFEPGIDFEQTLAEIVGGVTIAAAGVHALIGYFTANRRKVELAEPQALTPDDL